MIVLRHREATPTQLQVFYAAPMVSTSTTAVPTAANYNPITTNTILTWDNPSTISTPLIFGGNYEGNTTTIENNRNTRKPPCGVIYWAKFWDKDLGSKNCNALAAWPHETVPFVLSGFKNEASPNEQILEDTNLTFVAL
jgi:hypothetical protein